jgi:ATP-binding cassette subfamily B protein RaxB
MLARAAYRRPAILFLDEATSHLDSETESAINRQLAALRMTRVIVSHRQEILALADRVIQLQPNGRTTPWRKR